MKNAQLRKGGVVLFLSALTAVVAAFVLVPVIWALSTSLKTSGDILRPTPNFIPQPPTLANYAAFLSQGGVQAAINSAVVTFGTIVLAVIVGVAGGYALSRTRYRRKNALVVFLVAALAVPGYSLLSPITVMATTLHLTNNLATLIVIYASLSVPFVVWLMKAQVDAVPREIEQAAAMDGYSRFATIRKIVLPVIRPGILAAALFAALTAWNDYVINSVLTSDQSHRTIPAALQFFMTTLGIDWGPLMAGAILATLPPVLLFLVFRRQVTQGLASSGAVKG